MAGVKIEIRSANNWVFLENKSIDKKIISFSYKKKTKTVKHSNSQFQDDNTRIIPLCEWKGASGGVNG